jgi:hypothetical protein
MNDFLVTELARHWMSRVVREAELARLMQAAETPRTGRSRRRRRLTQPDR